MNLEELFSLQAELDKIISINHNLAHNNLFSKKIIALIVEVSELANATRCFKYWSYKQPEPKEIVLEEFADCLHFTISLGVEIGFNNFNKIIYEKCSVPLYEQFLNLYIDVNDFLACHNEENFISIFNDLICMGLSMNFTIIELFDSYIKKYEYFKNTYKFVYKVKQDCSDLIK
ncbi:MAG: dUTP diphosphatase [Oscillospiraceae bacterium]|nr:dUTP diphosphatase [Oscillospiraceae bacterium]